MADNSYKYRIYFKNGLSIDVEVSQEVKIDDEGRLYRAPEVMGIEVGELIVHMDEVQAIVRSDNLNNEPSGPRVRSV